MGDRTIIVGGGLAGLAAATALAERRIPVTLLESRPRLGGRASSFTDRATGTQIDNCQHVSMGCCTNFQKFCDNLGLLPLLRTQPELYFVGSDNRVNPVACGRLPAPLHLWSSFRKLSYLSRRDLWAIATGLYALARADAAACDGQSFASWLHKHGQTDAAIERFWRVVLVSALSETLDRIDVAHARKVFADAFLSNPNGWNVLIPAVPLDELYGSHISDWLGSRGADVRLQCGVRQLVLQDDAVVAVELRSGEQLRGEHFVVAVPHHRIFSLLPECLHKRPEFCGVSRLESAPITSMHLWFDRPITTLPHAVFVGRLSQWMFNRSVLQSLDRRDNARSERTEGRYYYQVVISASRNLEGRSQRQTIEDVVSELSQVWPETKQARLVHSRQVTEHKAVFSVKPGADALRPAQQSSVANLQLAGDWTQTGWPATMEGAVRSGYLAAENVLTHLGRGERLLQPDLPVAPLSKLLLGL